MRKRRPVRFVDELSLNEYGRLTNGIFCGKYIWGDCYTASKETLIATGIAQAEWFPSAPLPIPNRPGKFQRSFTAETERGEVKLREDSHAGKWTVGIPISTEEKKHRDAEWAEHCQHVNAELGWEQTDKLDREMERLPSILRSLPPFVPGSMSEAERHHMRILRGLNERRRSTVMEFAERFLAAPNDDDVDHQPQAAPEKRRLHLVVDNDAPSG